MPSQENFCINCKVNLDENDHTQACKFIQKAEKERLEIERKANESIAKAKQELQSKLDDEKEKITKQVRKELEKEIADEKQKKQELLLKKDNETKQKFITKIIQFMPKDEINVSALQKKPLKELMPFYTKIIKLTVAENNKKYSVSCPKCNISLGKSNTEEQGIEIQNQHKNDCTKNKKSNIGNWLILGFALSAIAGLSAFVLSNKHILKKGEKDE